MAQYLLRKGVAFVSIAKGKHNELGCVTRTAILQCLEQSCKDDAKAVVFTGAGKQFSVGGDRKEFITGRYLTHPSLSHVINALEDLRVPIVAGVHGLCTDEALELALSCTHRAAHANSLFGYPSVHELGIMPGSGGTLRSAQLLGLHNAVNFLTSGQLIGVEEGVANGLIDSVFVPETPVKSGEEYVYESEFDGWLCSYAETLSSTLSTPILCHNRDRPFPTVLSLASNNTATVEEGGQVAQWQELEKIVRHRSNGLFAPMALFHFMQSLCSQREPPLNPSILHYEQQVFSELKKSEQAIALQYIYFSELKYKIDKDSAKPLDCDLFAGCVVEACRLVLEGVTPGRIGSALQTQLNWPLNIFGLVDKINGGDEESVGRRMLTELLASECDGHTTPLDTDCLISAMQSLPRGDGWDLLSQESGTLLYSESTTDLIHRLYLKRSESACDSYESPTDEPTTLTILTDEEIVERFMYVFINDTLKLLQDGTFPKGLNPNELDVILVNQFDFPRHKGGAMFWAENSAKFAEVLVRLKHYAAQYPIAKHYDPCPLLVDLVESGANLKEELYYRAQG